MKHNMMFLKPRLSLFLLTGLAFISALAGQSILYSAGADSPVSGSPSPMPDSSDLTSAQRRADLAPLRFKKEDFVPIPDLAPIPLDEPQLVAKKPKQVKTPAADGISPPTPVRKAHLSPLAPAPVAAINQPLETLSPAAGPDTPPASASLIPLTDLPPEPPLPVIEKPTLPVVKAAADVSSPTPAQAGTPLISLPGSEVMPTAALTPIPAVAATPPLPPQATPPLDTSPPSPPHSAAEPLLGGDIVVPDATPKPEPAALPPIAKKRHVAHKKKAPELPPEPALATDTPTLPTLPANVPADAVQHWSGPNAVEPSAINTLPPALLSPASEVASAVQATQTDSPAPVPLTPAPAETADKTEPKPTLSEESKKIAHNLHPVSPNKAHGASKPVLVTHARDLKSLDQPSQVVDAAVSHEVSGMKIEVKQPRINFSYELDKAYMALIGGQSNVAIATYKKVLDNDPNNKNALFGLATAYHRVGQIDLARPVYAKLLAIDPGNTDGLNNFLVLLSDEAPEEALAELEKLAQRNPQYSALPAQMAVIYQKLGQYDKAGDYMLRAIDMAPENLTYRYNLAIMFDKQHKYEEAAKLYHQIVQAYQRGETIPGNVQKIQQRLTFISSNRPS